MATDKAHRRQLWIAWYAKVKNDPDYQAKKHARDKVYRDKDPLGYAQKQHLNYERHKDARKKAVAIRVVNKYAEVNSYFTEINKNPRRQFCKRMAGRARGYTQRSGEHVTAKHLIDFVDTVVSQNNGLLQCFYCGTPLAQYEPNGFTIDHILRLEKSRSSAWSNLAICCWDCMKKKHRQEGYERRLESLTNEH